MHAIGLFFDSNMPYSVQAYIKDGWAATLIDPDGTTILGTDTSASNPTNDDAILIPGKYQDITNHL